MVSYEVLNAGLIGRRRVGRIGPPAYTKKEYFMMRNLLLKVMAPAVMAIGGVPAIASAHSHVAIGFSFGFAGNCYQPAYYAPAYCAPAPAVVYASPAPVVCTPPVVYAPPAVVYTQPAYVSPAPVVVYSPGYYSRPYFYDHVRWYRR
jgi:hypothetical protein